MRGLSFSRSPIAELFEDLPRMFFQAQQNNMNMQLGLLDRQIARREKKYDRELEALNTLEETYSDKTGEVFNLKDLDQSGNAETVLEEMKGPVIDSYRYYLNTLNEDIKEVQESKSLIGKRLGAIDRIESFYKGRGHDFTGGTDPERWDLEDFNEEAWSSYVEDKPELQNVEGYPYLMGVKSRQNQNKLQNIAELNKNLDDARIAKARADVAEYEASLKDSTVDQNNLKQMQIKGNLINMTYPKALGVASGVLSEGIGLMIERAGLESEGSSTSKIDDEIKQDALAIGTMINPFASPDQKELLGKNLIMSAQTFVGTYDMKDLNKSNYSGWIDSMDEIYMTSMGFEELKNNNDPQFTEAMYNAHKIGVEQLTGWNYEQFMNEAYPAMKISEENLENFQIDQALLGLKEGVDSTFPSVSGVWEDKSNVLPSPSEGKRVTIEDYVNEYSATDQIPYLNFITEELGISRDTNLVDIDTTQLSLIQARFEGWEVEGSRPRRNNNPGNLKPGSLERAQKFWNGVVGIDEDGFAIFESPEAGFMALEQEINVEKSRHAQVEDATMSQIGDISIDQLTGAGFSLDEAENAEDVRSLIEIINRKKEQNDNESGGWFDWLYQERPEEDIQTGSSEWVKSLKNKE